MQLLKHISGGQASQKLSAKNNGVEFTYSCERKVQFSKVLKLIDHSYVDSSSIGSKSSINWSMILVKKKPLDEKACFNIDGIVIKKNSLLSEVWKILMGFMKNGFTLKEIQCGVALVRRNVFGNAVTFNRGIKSCCRTFWRQLEDKELDEL